jgi:ketosteroid isomerase-like protein
VDSRRRDISYAIGMDTRPAREPQDLSRFFVERANDGDLDGLMALYEPRALLAGPKGQVFLGEDAIRDFYGQFLATRPKLEPGQQREPVVEGELALTSTRLVDGSVTVEIARRQADGTWRWVIDHPFAAIQ